MLCISEPFPRPIHQSLRNIMHGKVKKIDNIRTKKPNQHISKTGKQILNETIQMHKAACVYKDQNETPPIIDNLS